MILILLYDMRWRIALLLVPAVILFLIDHSFRPIEQLELEPTGFSPLDVSAALGYFAAFSMMILLSGTVSPDRREGYTRLFFSHPTSPLAFYGLRWGLAYAISVSGAFLLLLVGQLLSWGGIRGGWLGLVLPMLTALIYGGLIAFFSVLLPRGETLLVIILFLPTVITEVLQPLNRLIAPVRDAILLLLPPNGALAQVYVNMRYEEPWGGAAVFAAAYGLIFLTAAAIALRLREWP
jgi:hypothetical protein